MFLISNESKNSFHMYKVVNIIERENENYWESIHEKNKNYFDVLISCLKILFLSTKSKIFIEYILFPRKAVYWS